MSDLSFSINDYLKIRSIFLTTSSNSEPVTPFIDTSLLDNLQDLHITDDYGTTDIKLPNNKSLFRSFKILNYQTGGLNTTLDFTGYNNLNNITVTDNPNLTIRIPNDLSSNNGNDYQFLDVIDTENCDIRWTLPSDKQLPNNLRFVEILGDEGLVSGPLPTDLPSNMTHWKILGNQHTITGQPPASFTNAIRQYRVLGQSCNFDGTDFIVEPTGSLQWYQVANDSVDIGTHQGEIPQFNNATNLVVFNLVGCRIVGTMGASFPTNMHTKCPFMKAFKIGGRGGTSSAYHGSLGTFTVPRFGSKMNYITMTNMRNGFETPLITGFAANCFVDSNDWSVIDLRYNNMSQATVDILIDRLYDIDISNTNPLVKLEGNHHPTVDDPNQTTFNLTRRTAGDEGADTGNTKVNEMIDAGISFTASTSGTFDWIN